MFEKLKEMTHESMLTVIPIIAVVVAFTAFIQPMPAQMLLLFLFGAVLLVVGMGLLTTGVDMALMPLGGDIGSSMTKSRKMLLICVFSFVMGATISFAEPDLQVLSKLVPGIERWTLLITVSIGVGLSMLMAVLRIILNVSLSKIIIVCYAIMISLAIIAPSNFVPIAFDAGGVVTGPIAVPFILAMGLGVASIRADKTSLDDSFGLVALCIIGPVISVLLLGIVFSPQGAPYAPPPIPELSSTNDITMEFLSHLPYHLVDVARSVWPIIAVFAIYQAITRRYHRKSFFRMLMGFAYTYVGLVLFMTGVDVGFIPIGTFLGSDLSASAYRWLLIPLAALLGYFSCAAEPAIHALRKQVEEVSLGVIPGAAVMRYLSVGVAIALACTMLRILYHIPIYFFLFPCYLSAIILTFFSPKMYTGIAFDTAGAVTGPMTSTFLLPFAIGVCLDRERIMLDAFGTVALIAMTPPVSLQIMGVVYKRKAQLVLPDKPDVDIDDDAIIVFDEKGGDAVDD